MERRGRKGSVRALRDKDKVAIFAACALLESKLL